MYVSYSFIYMSKKCEGVKNKEMWWSGSTTSSANMELKAEKPKHTVLL